MNSYEIRLKFKQSEKRNRISNLVFKKLYFDWSNSNSMSILICSLIRVLNRKRKKLWFSEQEMRQVVWFITYVLVRFFTADYVITMSIRNHTRRRAKNIEHFVERYSSGEQSYLYHNGRHHWGIYARLLGL